MKDYDTVVVGGGIVGLATAMALLTRAPGSRVAVLEKENEVGLHQTGHNSGVIHSGIYYRPGSSKATLATSGSRLMVEFCQRHGLTYEICGKVIVATEQRELPLLDTLYKRGLENGLQVRKIDPGELAKLEPHVFGIAAIHVPDAGIVDYREVAATLARLIREAGGELHLGHRVEAIRETGDAVVIETSRGSFKADVLVNCGGLHSDRIARMAGVDPDVRIVPFRGEYYELAPGRRSLVRNLVYPVPDPDFPFLGVHFTRMIDGAVHAGPNAVLAFRREGYTKTSFDATDLWEVLTYGGFWKLAGRHARQGLEEVVRSISKAAFVRGLQRLIPELEARDVVPSGAGVRAQALRPDGSLVDDFLFVTGTRSVHVVNAPSPAATASLAIGEVVADRVDQLLLARRA